MINFLASRQEGVALRPFVQTGLAEKKLQDCATLKVESSFGVDQVLARGWLGLPKAEIGKLGLTLEFADLDELLRAVDKAVITLDDVEVLVVARDRPNSVLRETAVLQRIAVRDLDTTIYISQKGVEPVSRILANQFGGFEIELAFVLSRDAEGSNPISPRTKGALVAKVSFGVRPTVEAESFQPEILTDEVRNRLGLNKSAWVYVESLPGLLTAESLKETARFYVHEDILNNIRFLSGAIGRISQELLLTQFITALIYEISIALRNQDAPSAEEVAESQLFRLLSKRFSNKAIPELMRWLRDEPESVLAAWQANSSGSKSLLSAFENLNGGQDDISNSEG